MRWTDADTGVTYTLDFNKESIRFAENNKFDISEVLTYASTGTEDLFYYALRMYHRHLSRTQANALFVKLGGFTAAEIERLVLLFRQAQYSNAILNDEDVAKNRRGTVELD